MSGMQNRKKSDLSSHNLIKFLQQLRNFYTIDFTISTWDLFN